MDVALRIIGVVGFVLACLDYFHLTPKAEWFFDKVIRGGCEKLLALLRRGVDREHERLKERENERERRARISEFVEQLFPDHLAGRVDYPKEKDAIAVRADRIIARKILKERGISSEKDFGYVTIALIDDVLNYSGADRRSVTVRAYVEHLFAVFAGLFILLSVFLIVILIRDSMTEDSIGMMAMLYIAFIAALAGILFFLYWITYFINWLYLRFIYILVGVFSTLVWLLVFPVVMTLRILDAPRQGVVATIGFGIAIISIVAQFLT